MKLIELRAAKSHELRATKSYAYGAAKLYVSRSAIFLALLGFLYAVPGASGQFDPEEIVRVYEAGDYQQVQTIARARLAIDAYDVRARYYLASVLLKQKRGQEALVQFQACSKCGGTSELARLARQAIAVLEADRKKANSQYFVKSKPVLKATDPPPQIEQLDAKTKEAISRLEKELSDAIEVKRLRQNLELESIAEEQALAMEQAANTLSIHRDQLIESVQAEATAKRAKVNKLYREEEASITRAYELRIKALKESHQ